ncbi:Protein GID8 homolog [Linum perenne]
MRKSRTVAVQITTEMVTSSICLYIDKPWKKVSSKNRLGMFFHLFLQVVERMLALAASRNGINVSIFSRTLSEMDAMVITRREWEKKLNDVTFGKEDVNKLVMNFFITEGYVDAAEKLCRESGTQQISRIRNYKLSRFFTDNQTTDLEPFLSKGGILRGTRRERLLSKFVENEYEKIDRLMELYIRHKSMRARIELLLKQYNLSKQDVKDVLQEYHDNIGDLDGSEEKERAQTRILKFISAF